MRKTEKIMNKWNVKTVVSRPEFDTLLAKKLKKHSKSFFRLVRSRKPERRFLERIGY